MPQVVTRIEEHVAGAPQEEEGEILKVLEFWPTATHTRRMKSGKQSQEVLTAGLHCGLRIFQNTFSVPWIHVLGRPLQGMT